MGQRLWVSAAVANGDWAECQLVGAEEQQPFACSEASPLLLVVKHIQSKGGWQEKSPEGQGHWGSES